MKVNDNHPFFTSCNDIIDICSPLKSLGIHYFSYTRNYNDGSRLYLCTEVGAMLNHLNQQLYLQGPCEATPTSYKSQVMLWNNMPNQDVYDWVKQHNIGNGILFISPQKNYCEFATFAGHVANRELNNVYYSNFDFLKKFITSYFINAIDKSMLKTLENNKIMVPHHTNTVSKVPIISSDNPLFDLNVKLSKFKLTKRQLECCYWLMQGKTTKEIGNIIGLSRRTVEDYLSHIRSKLGCNNKTELIIKLTTIL